MVTGFVGHNENGFDQRFTEKELYTLSTASLSPLTLKCQFRQEELNNLEKEACTYFFDNRSIAVLGNSHATELAYGLAKELEPFGIGILHHTISGCKHNYLKQGEEQTACYKWHKKIVESLLKDQSIKTVVVSYRNEEYIENKDYRNSLVKMIEKISSVDKKVILVLQAPLAGMHINKHLRKAFFNQRSDMIGLSNENWDEIYTSHLSLLEELPASTIIVNPKHLLCDNYGCYVIKNNIALYYDNNHLFIEGASIVARYIFHEYINK